MTDREIFVGLLVLASIISGVLFVAFGQITVRKLILKHQQDKSNTCAVMVEILTITNYTDGTGNNQRKKKDN